MKFKMTPYWICQLLGWGLATSYWVYFMLINPNMTLGEGLLNTTATLVSCIGMTHLYYLFAHRFGWHELDIRALIPRVTIGIIVLAFLFVISMIPINFLTGAKCEACNLMAHIQEGWLRYSMTGLRLMAIWTLAFHMYHYARVGAKAETEKAQLAEQVSLAQMEKLKDQLNPHFLFNALNSVKSLINSDQDKARRATVLLSDILRNSLNASKKKFVTLEEEIQQVKDYLELEKMRFEDRLQIIFTIDETLLNTNVPPLCIQILIENAIKHGIAKLKDGGEVHLLIEKMEGFLKVVVSSSGALKKAIENGKESFGLENLKRRLSLIYHRKAHFNIYQKEENIVSAEILIPLKEVYDPVHSHR